MGGKARMSENHQSLGDLLPSWRENRLTGRPPVSYDTGLPVQGVAQGRMLLIGGPPKVGKTALIMGCGFHALRRYPELVAVVCNVEMSPQELLDREAARASGIPLDWITNREFRNHEELVGQFEAAADGLAAMAERLVFVRPPFSLEAVDDAIDGTDARLVILDYVQRVSVYSQQSRNPSDPRQRMNEAMTMIRGLADQQRAVIVVSAVSRGNGKEKYENLNMASFRESSELEYGCNSAYTLERNGTSAMLKHHANRNGQTHDVPLEFDGSLQRFTWTGGKTYA